MAGFASVFGKDDALFDNYDEFVLDHIPPTDRFLQGHEVLVDDDHLAFHRLTRDLFETRTVYDMTFDYNLARLNLDTRHRNAGYRYARQADDRSVLRAEFTPTTPFCPQTRTLTIGSFRAWNGLTDRHEYDVVRVRTAPMHHRSGAINDRLAALEERFLETGELTGGSTGDRLGAERDGGGPAEPDASRGYGQPPF